MTATEYFCGDELPASVWSEKYGLRDAADTLVETSPDDMHWRIARELGRVEESKFDKPYSVEFIYDRLRDFNEIIPQGSPMYGIGNPQFVSLSNCFVCSPPTDSYGGIMLTDQQMVQLCKRRGGVGTDISEIRPDSMPTTNSARRATGIVPFMERFSNSIREVAQKGRRGALMLTLSVHHPQVLDFTRVKLDPTKVTGANVSIRLTDEFLNAVEADAEYEQRWPVDSSSPTVSRRVRAREVWEEIVRCAHARAEPGLLFWDQILRESPADCYPQFRTVSTNPCQPKWALLLTPNGLRTMGEIREGDAVWSEDGWTKVRRKWSTGVKKVYRYRTTSGVVYATDNHRVVEGGEKVELSAAEAIDGLSGPPFVGFEHDPQAVMDGLYFGDGASNYHHSEVLYIGKDDQCYFDSEVAPFISEKFEGFGSKYAWRVVSSLTSSDLALAHEKRVPLVYKQGSPKEVASFLRGLFSANGSVVRNRVTFKTNSRQLVEDVQTLLSSLGIASYYTTNKAHDVEFANGIYTCRESYDINVTRDREKFARLIGFVHPHKTEKLTRAVAETTVSGKQKMTHDVIATDFVSEEEVFDIEVEGTHHTYWHGGHNVSNCSEIALSVLDSCRLLVVNFFACVRNPFVRRKAEFNFDLLYELAYVGQRLMDDIVDLEVECVDRVLGKIATDPEPDDVKAVETAMWQRVRAAAIDGRRTGLGPTAIGDALAALGVGYGTEKSVALVDRFYRTLKLGAYRASVDMAKELGPFPAWDAAKEKECPFLLRIRDEDPELYADMQKHGRRNIALLTTAPAGSVSILTGPRPYFGTTSGFEPLFRDRPYTRRKKVNHAEKDVRIDFTDQNGDQWTEYPVFHSKLRMWMEVTGETDWTKSPYHGFCAEDIDWRQRVKLQAAAQRHVDHAISSTVNLPNEVSVEKVAEIYETAWKAGCKGITVYRDGCRTGVLVDAKQVKTGGDRIDKTTAPKRPKELPCDVHRTTVKGTPHTVFVGLLGGDPYEVFALVGAVEEAAAGCDGGVLEKKSRGVYRFLCGEAVVDITEQLTDEQAAVTRLASTALRHGTDVGFVVHQLEKVRGDLTGFAKAVARVLKKYVNDGTKVSGEKCGRCDSDELVRQEGCVTCRACGWSKCN